MRTLSEILTATQKTLAINPLIKISIDGGTYEYDGSRILNSIHTEKPWSQSAEVYLDDFDKELHNSDLEGLTAVISYGIQTSEAEEDWYSSTAPLSIVAQQRDSYRGKLLCSLSLRGIMDMLAEDKASESYSREPDDANTVKTLLDAIAGASLAPYTHCTPYTITYDDAIPAGNLINTFKPADFFGVYLNDNRLSKIKELLQYTTCQIRAQADGVLYVFIPKSAEPYDYEYSLADTYHTFLSKRFRRRIVFPNYIVVTNHPDQTPVGYGEALDESASLIEKREYHYLRVTGNTQAGKIATALLSKYQLDAEKGAASLPVMNLGAEVFDYVNITDSRAGDSRAGNLGWLTRKYSRGKFTMDFGFGRQTIIPMTDYAVLEGGGDLASQVSALYDYIDEITAILEETMTIDMFNDWYHDFVANAWFKKLIVTEQLIIPAWG